MGTLHTTGTCTCTLEFTDNYTVHTKSGCQGCETGYTVHSTVQYLSQALSG